ncbi:ABC transporter ATP-binding protein [Latilactobacillus curvatus]|nr:ABC transporter ATP-binding protein [Latilactobacillus curvatus]
MVNTILKEADLFCPNSVRINFTIYRNSLWQKKQSCYVVQQGCQQVY